MIRLTVRLDEMEREAIVKLAQSERRDPRDQAALMIHQALEQRGLLPCEAAPTNGQSENAAIINQAADCGA